MKNVAAGIVLYNPDINRLKENINAVINQVELLILVDNGSTSISYIENEISYFSKIILIKNSKNYGISRALNQIIEFCLENQYKWVMTLDQDSVVPIDIIHNYMKYVNYDKIAVICPNIIDRNDSTERNNIENKLDETVYIQKSITSASFINVNVCKELGFFDEKMFIDLVDFEYCLRVINSGYRILKNNNVTMIHQLGDMRVYNIFSKRIFVTNHSKERLYYYARNSLYYLDKHKSILRTKDIFWDLFKKINKIIFFEKNKLTKIIYFIRGISDGINKRMGEINTK